MRSAILTALAPLEALGRCKVVPIEAGGKSPSQRGHGARKGTPDLLVLLASGVCVWFELKDLKTGRLSADQKKWASDVIRLGHAVYVATSVDDVMEIVLRNRP